MASAYLGSTFIPPLYGVLGKLFGYAILPMYLIVFLILMIVMIERTFRMTEREKEGVCDTSGLECE